MPTTVEPRQCKGRGGKRLASGGDPLTESVKMTKRSGEQERRVFANKRSSEARIKLDERASKKVDREGEPKARCQ